jgi:hypothetical protein
MVMFPLLKEKACLVFGSVKQTGDVFTMSEDDEECYCAREYSQRQEWCLEHSYDPDGE